MIQKRERGLEGPLYSGRLRPYRQRCLAGDFSDVFLGLGHGHGQADHSAGQTAQHANDLRHVAVGVDVVLASWRSLTEFPKAPNKKPAQGGLAGQSAHDADDSGSA